MGVLDALLEGFAAQPTDPLPAAGGAFAIGDQVRVATPGGESIVGRVRRPHHADPKHVVVSPESGGPHVVAPVAHTSLDSPAQHRAEAKRRADERAAQRAEDLKAAGVAQPKPGAPEADASKPPVRESLLGSLLSEAFAAAPITPSETPAQSVSRARGQVAQANREIGDFNAKHPRQAGGRFGNKGNARTGGSGKRGRKATAGTQNVLNLGAKGTLVRAVQQQLRVPASGTYDQATRDAVLSYQRQHHLLEDGIVGAQTIGALRGVPHPERIKPGPITARVARVANPHTRKVAPVRVGGGLVV